MASIQQRGKNKFQVQVRRVGYAPVSRMFARKSEAEAFVRDVEGRIDRGHLIATKTAQQLSLGDCLRRYLKTYTPQKKGRVQETSRINCWLKYPIVLRPMASLRGSDFAAYRDERLAQGAAASTVRSELSIVSRVFDAAAAEWDMEGLANPVKAMTKPKVDDQRERRVKHAVMRLGDSPATMISELDAIKHFTGSLELPALIDIAVTTTMRRGEIAGVHREHVDLVRRTIRLPKTKNGKERFVPLSLDAVECLSEHFAITKGKTVFSMRPDSITQAFARACARARLAYEAQCAQDPSLEADPGFLIGLRFHDLRHEGTSRHAMRPGMSIQGLKAVTGHKSLRSLDRYMHIEAAAIARTLD